MSSYSQAVAQSTNDISRFVVRVGDHYESHSRRAELWPAKYHTVDGILNVVTKVLRCVTHLDSNHHQRLLDCVTTWKSLNHPNISQIYGVTFEGLFSALVLPHFPNGNIIWYLKHNPALSPKEVFTLIKEALSGLVYLHENGVIHCNPHGGNILINEGGHAVWSDIGMESVICVFEPWSGKVSGNCRWWAPELLIPDDEATSMQPTTASDVYAMGSTTVEVYTLLPPHNDHAQNDYQFIWRLGEGLLADLEKPENMNHEIWYVLKHCWAPQPEKRPTASELLHRFEGIEFE